MLKRIIKKIIYGVKADSDSYISYLRSIGVKIGEGTRIYVPTKTLIDTTRPWLIDIGNNVNITEGVTILTHGYDWAVLKGVYGEILGSAGQVKIGNNVFIGVHSTVLKGVNIGNNVIIGANSLVTKDIPDNCVAAGNPCKVIMSLDEYYKKRQEAQLSEATELVRLYRSRYGTEVTYEALHEFFWLFEDGGNALPECWEKMMKINGNYKETNKNLTNYNRKFNGIEEFLNNIE